MEAIVRAEIPVDVRHDLHDPRTVVRALGLEAGAVRQGRNVVVRCPWHDERSPSCSVHVARDGTLAVRCHGCGATGDALALVAVAHGLDPRRDFVEVVTVAAELAGRWDLVDELRGNVERRPAPTPKPRREPEPERDYPPIGEVAALLTRPAWEDPEARAYLTSRAIDPGRLEVASVGVTFPGVEVGAVAYALDASAVLPRWASYQGRSWQETGHRLILPMVDASGELRSVRACRVEDADSPKRLPPGGHRAGGLVMANDVALALLRGTWQPSADLRVGVRIVEGEPDFLTVVAAPSAAIATAVFGIVSGTWGTAFAARVPRHALVALQTHDDPAGARYAAEIRSSLDAAGVRVVTRITP
jgi:hypothetical protein